MHRHHQSKPGDYRGWLTFELPDNPVCWLFGHTPKVTIHESKYASIEAWLSIECRICDRRYQERDLSAHRRTRAEQRELTARRVENARRLPAREFLADVSRRVGWEPREVALHHQTLWPTRGGKRRFNDRGFSLRLHFGGRGSETPIDAHAQVGPFATYVTVGGIGGRFCEWIGRGHKRDLSLSAHGGSLWWKVWYDDDGGYDDHHRCDKWRRPKLWPWSAGREKHRSWMCLRDGSIDLNPADALWGRAKFHFEDVATAEAFVTPGEFPGDTYLVAFKLCREHRHRDHGPRWSRRVVSDDYVVDWRCEPTGIPVRNDSWKGDGIIRAGCSLPAGWRPGAGPDWLPLAVEAVTEQVKRDRRRYGYQPPRPAAAQEAELAPE